MEKKSSSAQAVEANGVSFKSLLPVVLFATVVVVTIGLLGRRATEK